MGTTSPPPAQTVNHTALARSQDLSQRVAFLRARLHEQSNTERVEQLRNTLQIWESKHTSNPLPWMHLRTRLHLTPLEEDALALLAFAWVWHTDPTPLTAPHLARALHTLGYRDVPSILDLVSTSTKLKRLGCITTHPTTSEIQPAPFWTAFLRGVRYLGEDEERAASWHNLTTPPSPPNIPKQDLQNLQFLWNTSLSTPTNQPPWVFLCSHSPDAPRNLAMHLAHTAQRNAITLHGDVLAEMPPATFEALLTQAQFFEEVAVLERADILFQAPKNAAHVKLWTRALQDGLLGCALGADPDPILNALNDSAPIDYTIPKPPPPQTHLPTVWQQHLGEHCTLSPQIDERFLRTLNLPPETLAPVCTLLRRLTSPHTPLSPEMIQACVSLHTQPSPNTPKKTQNTPPPNLSLRDLILHPKARAEIEHIIRSVRVRDRVLDAWGFSSILHRGTGLVCLLNGEPGTGKTLCAEVLALETGRTLQHVDVGSVVDKYIGETQKNLARIFDQSDPKRDLILFDEADSLFSKRTQVNRSTDRYSNMEINVLLQLIERYEGVVVLTTNLARHLDPAFERRIMFKVHFDLPDERMRERIWQMHLPSNAPLGPQVDIRTLAELYPLSGGAIKNAALRAAYRAASQNRPITHRDLDASARTEAVTAGLLVRDATPSGSTNL